MRMLSKVSAGATIFLADIGPGNAVAPPGAEKYQLLMNIALWVAAGMLACVGLFAGVKLALAYSAGTASRGEQMGLAMVCIGSVFAGTATVLVNTLMF